MTPLSQLMVTSQANQKIIARDDDKVWYWPEFSIAVAKLSIVLEQRDEQRWLLFENHSFWFSVGLMALLHSGKTIVLPPNDQLGTLADFTHRCDGMLGPQLEGFNCLGIEDTVIGQRHADNSLVELSPSQCFIEVVTSGSSGVPQVISKSLLCFEQELQCQYSLWYTDLKGCTVFSTVSHHHVYGLLFRVLLPLCCGLPFWSSAHQYPEQLFGDIEKHCKKAVLVSSPAHLGRLPETTDIQSSAASLQLIFSSGGPLSWLAADSVRERLNVTPVEILGSTETGGVAWRQQDKENPPWRPLPGIEWRSTDVDGFLQIKSPYCFESGWYQMGDKVESIEEGQFKLLGRGDRVVKIEEKRLSLPAMESRLQALEWVEQSRLLVLPGRRQQLAAVVQLTQIGKDLLDQQGKRFVNDALKKQLLNHFERVLLPRKWRYVEYLPFNSQGKLPLADLEALFDAVAG